MSRYETAKQIIANVHAGLSIDASLKIRTKEVDKAYPFGDRKYHPYKQWLKARREYLVKYGYETKAKKMDVS